MSFIFSTLHAWNSRLIPVFGFPLNALLFWLVWTKTPKEMIVHSRILLQTCIVDLIFLCFTLIGTPLLISHGSNSIVLLDGYFMRIFASIFSYDPMYFTLINYIAAIGVNFDIFSLSVQFVYRYFVLNRNIKICLTRYLMMLTLPFMVSAIICIYYAFNFSGPIVLNAELKASLEDYADWDNSIYIISTNNEAIWVLLIFSMMMIFYSINIFCGVKVAKFVGSHAGFNPRMKELNQQLTKTLIILAFIPLLTFIYILTICALIGLMHIAGINNLANIIMYLQVFGFLGGNWVPVANPIVGIWINRPYRDAVNKFFSNLFKKNSVTPTVKPSNP